MPLQQKASNFVTRSSSQALLRMKHPSMLYSLFAFKSNNTKCTPPPKLNTFNEETQWEWGKHSTITLVYLARWWLAERDKCSKAFLVVDDWQGSRGFPLWGPDVGVRWRACETQWVSCPCARPAWAAKEWAAPSVSPPGCSPALRSTRCPTKPAPPSESPRLALPSRESFGPNRGAGAVCDRATMCVLWRIGRWGECSAWCKNLCVRSCRRFWSWVLAGRVIRRGCAARPSCWTCY